MIVANRTEPVLAVERGCAWTHHHHTQEHYNPITTITATGISGKDERGGIVPIALLRGTATRASVGSVHLKGLNGLLEGAGDNPTLAQKAFQFFTSLTTSHRNSFVRTTNQ
jgi:hypothetical protein